MLTWDRSAVRSIPGQYSHSSGRGPRPITSNSAGGQTTTGLRPWSDSIRCRRGRARTSRWPIYADCSKAGTFVPKWHCDRPSTRAARAPRTLLNVRFEKHRQEFRFSISARSPSQTGVLAVRKTRARLCTTKTPAGLSRNNRNTIDTIPPGDSRSEHRPRWSAGDIEGIRTMYGTPVNHDNHPPPPGRTDGDRGWGRDCNAGDVQWPPGSRHTLDVAAAPQQKGRNHPLMCSRDGATMARATRTLVASRRTGWSAQNFAEQYSSDVGRTGRHRSRVDPASPDGFYAPASSVTIPSPKANAGFPFPAEGTIAGRNR